MFEWLNRKLLKWALKEQPLIPTEWPDDIWECVFLMAHIASEIKVEGPNLNHFDMELSLYTDNVDLLFHHVELMIKALENRADKPKLFSVRSREVSIVTVLDFCYSRKVGYRNLDDIREILIQKVAVVHYLFEDEGLKADELYYPYILKEFTFVMADVATVMEYLILHRK